MIIVLPRLKREGTGYQRQPDEVRIEFLRCTWMSLMNMGDTATHEHADMAWSTNQQTWVCGGMWAQGFKHVQIKCPKKWYRDRG
jgi:hypothetical protein